MMHQHLLSRPDEIVSDLRSVMCLFWDLEAASCSLYQRMAASESHPVRAELWRRLQNCHLLLGDSPPNHTVYMSQALLSSCKEAILQDQLDESPVDSDAFSVMAQITQLKFLQVMLVVSLRPQVSLVSIIDTKMFGASVAQVTHLVLSSRG